MSKWGQINNQSVTQCIYKGKKSLYTEEVAYYPNRIEHTVKINIGNGWFEIPIEEAEKEGITKFGSPTTYGENKPVLEWDDLPDK